MRNAVIAKSVKEVLRINIISSKTTSVTGLPNPNSRCLHDSLITCVCFFGLGLYLSAHGPAAHARADLFLIFGGYCTNGIYRTRDGLINFVSTALGIDMVSKSGVPCGKFLKRTRSQSREESMSRSF